MSKPEITIHNTETNEIVIREMNDEEYAQYQVDQEIFVKLQAEAEAKAAKRQALLDKLGITAEDAQLLLGGN